jgi:hypothetical protein
MHQVLHGGVSGRQKDHDGVPADIQPKYTLYTLTDLDACMVSIHQTKARWLKHIAMIGIKKQRREETAEQKERQLQLAIDSYLSTCSKSFQTYFSAKLKDLDLFSIKSCYTRFVILETELVKYGLSIRTDSSLYETHIRHGRESVYDVIQTMEEIKFLFANTNYRQLCNGHIDQFKEQERAYKRYVPMDANMLACLEYLAEPTTRGLSAKWRQCRTRYEEAKRLAWDMSCDHVVSYIYDNEHTVDDIMQCSQRGQCCEIGYHY